MLGDQESPTGFTPSLIAYIHASSIKIVSLLILSSVPSIMYLAGVKAGLKCHIYVDRSPFASWPLGVKGTVSREDSHA